HRGHDQREHDLHDVLDISHQITDLHGAVVDPDAADPDDGNHRQVHDEHHDRHHESHHFIDLDRNVRQIFVGVLQPSLFMLFPVEGTDDANAGQVFPQYQI